MKSYPSHRSITLLGGLAFASLGLETAIVSFSALGIRGEWQLSPREIALVIAAPGVGQLIGSIVLGSLSDRLGRRRMYGLSVALLTGFTALAGLAPDLAALCALLFLAGLGQGGAAPVVISMVAEAAPANSRGRMIAITELMFAAGWALAAFLGRSLAEGASWRALLAIGGVPLMLAPVGLWLLRADRERPLSAWETPSPAPSAALAAGAAREGIRVPGGLVTVWRSGFRAQGAVLWVLWLAMFGMLGGPVLWLPTLFATAGEAEPAVLGSFVALAMLVAAGLVLLCIDLLGRRPLLVSGLAVIGLCCAGLALARSERWLAPAGIGLGLALQFIWPVSLTYSAEMYPTAFRGLAVGWALGAGRLGIVAAPLVLGALLASYGQAAALLPFAVLALIAALLIALVGRETAGRALA